ncbi:MAG: nuclear transport factor 2 family protein [Gemmatimonadales bacterium]
MTAVRRVMPGLALLVLAGKLAAQAPDARTTLLAADRALSENVQARGLAAAMGDALTGDAVLLYSGAPIVQGADRARALLAGQPLLDSLSIQWQPLAAEVSPDGSFGMTYGVLVSTRSGVPGGTPVRLGKYISAWQRSDNQWRLAANVTMGLAPAAAYAVTDGSPLPRLPRLDRTGPHGSFVEADLRFAAQAGRAGAASAFAAWAAADAVTFPGSGELNRGPEMIRQSLEEGPQASWVWYPVAAGGSADGLLGFTAGEATITVPGDGGGTYYSKYLTLWRRGADGQVRFIADGGSTRPAQ